MNILDVVLRIFLAMIVGGAVGWERETTHRPAGLRTHMLVSVGAAVVMMIGEYSLYKYSGKASLDPMRLGSQVISGIGFLGAGTIMREGFAIKGLTTAASLWVVACLGLSAGAGLYELTAVGIVSIMIILTFFERIQKNLSGGKRTRIFVELLCRDASRALLLVTQLCPQYNAEISDISIEEASDDNYFVSFKLYFSVSQNAINHNQFAAEIASYKEITKVNLEPF